jgi:membrane-associated phospholipid phosphatase
MAFTTLMVMIVTYFERRFLWYGIALILLMALSRVHNGMHYPTDVLVGTLMGVIYGYI